MSPLWGKYPPQNYERRSERNGGAHLGSLGSCLVQTERPSDEVAPLPSLVA